MALVVLRAPSDHSRELALAGGISSGIDDAGCEAAVLVKAKANLEFANIWQVGTQLRGTATEREEGWTLGCTQILHLGMGWLDRPPQRKRPPAPWVMLLAVCAAASVRVSRVLVVPLSVMYLLCPAIR